MLDGENQSRQPKIRSEMAETLKTIIKQFVEAVVEVAKEESKNSASLGSLSESCKKTECLDDLDEHTTFSVYTDNLDLVIASGSSNSLSYKLYLPKNIDPSEVDVKINRNDSEFSISFLVGRCNYYGRVELEIPTKFKIYKSIEASNGDIRIQGVSVSELHVESDNGNVKIRKTRFDNAEVRCDNGNIDIRLDDDDYQISARAKNGDVDDEKGNSKNASKSLSCVSKNGDIFIR